MAYDPMTDTEFLPTLYADLIAAKEMLLADGGQFWRRSFVRNLYSVVEGCIAMLKAQTLWVYDKQGWPLTDAERAMLKEETYSLDARGVPCTHDKFLPTEANLRFVLELFLRPANPLFKVDVGGAGWAAFRAGLKMRHRITHPNVDESLQITDDEVRTLLAAADWFHDTFMGEQLKAIQAVKSSILPQPAA
jgi:hypothetical protein